MNSTKDEQGFVKLYTPGPTSVPDSILAAMKQPNVHHRTPEFRKVFGDAQVGLQELLDAATLPIFLTGSGTLGMEAALLNLSQAGEKIAVLNAGKFGERFLKLAERMKREVVELKAEWGTTVTTEGLNEFLSKNSDIAMFCVQHCETSTAVLHPLELVHEALSTHTPQALFVVDAISSAGAVEISCKNLGIDALICGSQKALMLPPGLSMLLLSERAWRKAEQNEVPSLYMDLSLERKAQEKGSSAWTPAIPLIFGLLEALQLINSEGPTNVYQRHRDLAEVTRSFFREKGFLLLAENCFSPCVTAAIPPKGVDAEQLRAGALSSGIRLAGGQNQFKGKIVRLGHMGAMSRAELESALSVISKLL